MIKPLKSIMLATNLEEYNKVAFDVAVSLATHYEAKLVLLHVLEKLPQQAENRLLWMFGKEQRDEAHKAEVEHAHKSLVGKNITSGVIRSALDEYCKRSGLDEATCGIVSREIIISEGDVVEDILTYSQEKGCGMIVLGTHEGLFSKSAISSHIKSILKRSTIPVLTVPTVFGK